jgi:hypothetical protein
MERQKGDLLLCVVIVKHMAKHMACSGPGLRTHVADFECNLLLCSLQFMLNKDVDCTVNILVLN